MGVVCSALAVWRAADDFNIPDKEGALRFVRSRTLGRKTSVDKDTTRK